jgi:hypothetical protein
MISGSLKTSNGMSISTGPPADVVHTKTVEGPPGPQGAPGPPGPQGDPGVPIVTVPFNQWPPANPVPDTLYLRLAP